MVQNYQRQSLMLRVNGFGFINGKVLLTRYANHVIRFMPQFNAQNNITYFDEPTMRSYMPCQFMIFHLKKKKKRNAKRLHE